MGINGDNAGGRLLTPRDGEDALVREFWGLAMGSILRAARPTRVTGEADERRSDAALGLLRAVRTHDPAMPGAASLATWVAVCVRREVRDGVRSRTGCRLKRPGMNARKLSLAWAGGDPGDIAQGGRDGLDGRAGPRQADRDHAAWRASARRIAAAAEAAEGAERALRRADTGRPWMRAAASALLAGATSKQAAEAGGVSESLVSQWLLSIPGAARKAGPAEGWRDRVLQALLAGMTLRDAARSGGVHEQSVSRLLKRVGGRQGLEKLKEAL